MALIYLVEDDPVFAKLACELLDKAGHQATVFDTPHQFFYHVGKLPPKCALVDWLLPEMNGVDVVRRLRQLLGRSVGVIMLTAMDAEESVVQALEAGADDYIVKPGLDGILLARIDALLRRLAPEAQPLQRVRSGPYELDFSTQTVLLDGEPIELAPREFDLAWTLFSQTSKLFTKQELLAAIWGKQGEYSFHTIAQHIYSIRKKLCLVERGYRLVAVYASGYRLEPPLPEASPDAL
jgi:two-component system, OmpR family, response regulator RegX3